MEALWAVVNATAQRSEEVQVMCAVDQDFLRDVSTAYANHDRHQLARGIMFSRCGLGADMGTLKSVDRAPRHGTQVKNGSWNARMRAVFPFVVLTYSNKAAADRVLNGGARGREGEFKVSFFSKVANRDLTVKVRLAAVGQEQMLTDPKEEWDFAPLPHGVEPVRADIQNVDIHGWDPGNDRMVGAVGQLIVNAQEEWRRSRGLRGDLRFVQAAPMRTGGVAVGVGLEMLMHVRPECMLNKVELYQGKGEERRRMGTVELWWHNAEHLPPKVPPSYEARRDGAGGLRTPSSGGGRGRHGTPPLGNKWDATVPAQGDQRSYAATAAQSARGGGGKGYAAAAAQNARGGGGKGVGGPPAQSARGGGGKGAGKPPPPFRATVPRGGWPEWAEYGGQPPGGRGGQGPSRGYGGQGGQGSWPRLSDKQGERESVKKQRSDAAGKAIPRPPPGPPSWGQGDPTAQVDRGKKPQKLLVHDPAAWSAYAQSAWGVDDARRVEMYDELTAHMGGLGQGPACQCSIFFTVRNGVFKVGCIDLSKAQRAEPQPESIPRCSGGPPCVWKGVRGVPTKPTIGQFAWPQGWETVDGRVGSRVLRPDLFSASPPIPADACGSEPEADAGEEGCATPPPRSPPSPPSGAKRGRARWGDDDEGTGSAGPSGLAASDPSGGGESGTQTLSSQGGLEETMAMSTEEANATFLEYDQKQESEAARGLSQMDLGDSVGAARSPGPVMY